MKRTPYSNTYYLREGKRRTVLGGVPNVLNDRGLYVPLDNELKVITTHPLAGYVVKQGPFWIGFHDKVHNKYASAVTLRTGESMIVTAINDVACTPTIIDKRTIQWKYPNGSWIREYATEKEIKEVIHQKAGQTIKFKYRLTGLTVKKVGNQIDFYRGDKKAFSILRPYYCTQDGEFISYVPVSWQKVGNDWEVTYPAPAQDSYIDPVIVFGEGAGMIGGDHKDTWIISTDIDEAQGANIFLQVRLLAVPGGRFILMRFSLTGHIPANAIVNTAILTLTLAIAPANNLAINASEIITPWGVTPIAEGITADPALGGQATWRRSFDFNGAGGDVAWAGGNISNADYNVAETNFNILAADAPGTLYNLNIPIMSQNWVNNDVNNDGIVLIATAGVLNTFANVHSQEAAALADRPYLTIDYDLPVTPIVPISQRNSHIAIHQSIGIK